MPQKRATALGFLLLALLLALGADLSWLVFGRGAQLSAAAAQQRLRSLDYYQYSRGDILDRQGRPLVNIEEPCLVVLPAMLAGREEQTAAALGDLLETGREQLLQRLQAAESGSFQPVVLKTGLSSGDAAAVNAAGLPGVLALTLAARYDRQNTACQLLGTVRPAGAEGEWQGVSGLELAYDSLLTGRQDARIQIEVDAQGRMQGQAQLSPAEQTRVPSLSLTLDKDYQQIAEQALAAEGLAGSCVVMDPNNGDIMALASWPVFDPYGWQEAPAGAYMQRTLLAYPPASTFKTVLAAAALEQEVRPSAPADTAETDDTAATDEPAGKDADALFCCSGSYTLSDGRKVSCAGGRAHGEVDLERALALSCNCYFVALGQELGGERVLAYASRLGLEQLAVTGLDSGDYDSGFLDFDGTQAGELANACLGEDGVRVSPVQEAVLFSAFVNGGFLVRPRLVTATDDGQGRLRRWSVEQPRRVLEPACADTLRLMLTAVVEEGTGAAARGRWASAGGKTGSSETGTVWFSGFFPAERPRLVVVVCLEQGSSGGTEAAAVFSRVADAICLLDGRV